jgi:adenylate cyclase
MDDGSTAGRASRTTDLSSQQWRVLLTEGHARLVKARHVFRHLPSEPHCKACNNPFGGVAGHMLTAGGIGPARKNPNLCKRCCDALPAGGAEVDVAVLFADVRGSTTLGEQAGAAEFYRRRAVEAGIDLLRVVGYGTADRPWLQLGAAVNPGVAYVGNVGAAVVDFTAVGDTVNVAARIQQHTAAGELIVARGVADELVSHVLPRILQLRGREQPTDAYVLTGWGTTT